MNHTKYLKLLCEEGVKTMRQAIALEVLADNPPPMTSTQLALAVGVTVAGSTGLSDVLEKRDLIHTYRDDEDRRKRMVTSTWRGRALIRRAREEGGDLESGAREALGLIVGASFYGATTGYYHCDPDAFVRARVELERLSAREEAAE